MARQRDNYKQVQHEDAISKARRAWTQLRIEQIHRNVSAYEILRRNGVDLKGSNNDRQEQFSCPFHGVDRKPSARVYPETARSPSHAWCFVCQERWDVIGLWRKFNGGDELPFSRALTQIEKAYGLVTPEMPKELGVSAPDSEAPSDALLAFDALYDACEKRLQLAKAGYHKLNDLVGYLSAGSVLDKLRYRVEHRQITPARGTEMLRQLLAKIGEKACLDA